MRSRERREDADGVSGIPSGPTSTDGARPRNFRWNRSHGLMSGPVLNSAVLLSFMFSTTFSARVRPRSSSYSVWKSWMPGSTRSLVGSTLGLERSMRIWAVAW
jgi:hypothetical protein